MYLTLDITKASRDTENYLIINCSNNVACRRVAQLFVGITYVKELPKCSGFCQLYFLSHCTPAFNLL